MPEHHAHSCVRLIAQQIEERRHDIQHRIPVHRHVLGLPDVHRAAAIARKIRWSDQACRNARSEELPVPRPVILFRDLARILPLEHGPDAFLHRPVGLPVTPRRHRVAVLAVLLIPVGIPRAAAHPLNQVWRDAIPLDRQ